MRPHLHKVSQVQVALNWCKAHGTIPIPGIRTPLQAKDVGELQEKLVGIQRVTKVTKGGRDFSFSAIVVVGNKGSNKPNSGVVGYGLGKSQEITIAIQKAMNSAKKNLIEIPIINGTIPHEQFSKFSGSRVYLKPASNGTGIKAGGAMRAVLEIVGIKDVLAKSKGSSNPHNLVKATFKALNNLRDSYMIANDRNISVKKVFNG